MSEATPRRLVAHGAVAELIDDPGSSPVGLVLAPTPAEPEIDPVDRSDLGRQVRGGMRWSLLNSVLLRFLNVAVSIVMARLLVPEDYGLYAVGTVVLMVLQSMNELGTSVAVVRWQGDVTRPARTATTLAYGSSFLLWGTTFMLAPAVADAAQRPRRHHPAASPVVQRADRCGVVDPQCAPDPRVHAAAAHDRRWGRSRAVERDQHHAGHAVGGGP